MSSKDIIKERQNKLLEMTGAFCAQHLDDEYYALCEQLINKLGRKREVPFKRGKLEIWASAVVYSIGTVNFLFDKSFEPYIKSAQICEYYGTNSSTVSNKASKIMDMLEIWHFSPEFTTQKMKERNPFDKMVFVDGLIVPVETLPTELQQMVKEAREQGEDIEFRTTE